MLTYTTKQLANPKHGTLPYMKEILPSDRGEARRRVVIGKECVPSIHHQLVNITSLDSLLLTQVFYEEYLKGGSCVRKA